MSNELGTMRAAFSEGFNHPERNPVGYACGVAVSFIIKGFFIGCGIVLAWRVFG